MFFDLDLAGCARDRLCDPVDADDYWDSVADGADRPDRTGNEPEDGRGEDEWRELDREARRQP
jgi:hypothetical protein